MDGRTFLGTARLLRNSRSDEAAYRSAISRAYYACFLTTRDMAFRGCPQEARNRGQIRNERRIGHTPLLYYLENGPTEDVIQLGRDLAALYGNRVEADYNMTTIINEDDAQDAIEEAEAILDTLTRINCADLGQAIENYLGPNQPQSS